jgi:hypothetical protein
LIVAAMLAVTLAGASWFGYELTTFFTHKRWHFLLRVFAGYPIGLIYQSFAALILQYYIPWGHTHLFAVLLTLGIPSIFLYIVNSRARVRNFISLRMIDLLILSLSAAFVVFRLHLVYFEKGEQTRGACYSDFSFHLGLISSLALGCNVNRSSLFHFETVISAGSPLAYPIFVNFHSAFLLADCDVSFPNAMRWSAFLVGICCVFLIHALAMRFTNEDSWAAALSLPLWGFTGGLGFLETFDYGVKRINAHLNYIHDFNNNKKAYWLQSLTHIFHPQRSATFALPLCYTAINALLCGVEKFQWNFFLFAGLIVAVTPQTQVHAFVALACFSIALAAVTFPFDARWKTAVRCWTVFGVAANAIALPLWLPFVGRASKSNFLSFRPIWENRIYTPNGSFFGLWWKSLGVFGLISLVFGYAVADAKQIRLYLAAMAVFFIASTVMFQPWDLDNCKVFQDGWLPLAVPFVGQYFSRIWRRSPHFVIHLFLILLFCSALGSGILNLILYEGYGSHIRHASRVLSGMWVAENTPVHSIFHSTTGEVMIPSACYAGRPLFQGYLGWTDSHGLTNASRNELVRSFDIGDLPGVAQAEGVLYNMKISPSADILAQFADKSWYEPVMSYEAYWIWKLKVKPVRHRPGATPKPVSKKKRRWNYT